MSKLNQKRILIADDDKQLVDVLSRRCQSLGLEVIETYDALSALKLVYTCAPDVLCLDVNMPPGGGLSVCEMLSKDDTYAEISAIMLTGEKDDDTIRRCHEMCAHYVEKGGDIWSRVEPLLVDLLKLSAPPDEVPETPTASDEGAAVPPRSVDSASDDPIRDAVFGALGLDQSYLDGTDSGPASPVQSTGTDLSPWVLHVDDDPEMRELMKMRLEMHGISVVSAFDGTSGVRTALVHPASAIILDYEMPNGTGDYVLRRLKDNPNTRDIPVIMLTGVKDRFLERRLLDMGAAAFFNKPANVDFLIAELQKHMDRSRPDPVTV